MKRTTASALFGALSAAIVHAAPVVEKAPRDVDDRFPYTGPAIPIGDWVDNTVNGNGKGFPRLVEPPAVKPATANPTNNINVVALSYIPQGMSIHYQTPFGLGEVPSIQWGTTATDLDYQATGYSHTYDRTPPCSLVAAVTQCSQFFHEVQIGGLKADTTYYYQIAAANGTTASDVLSFTTARDVGDSKEFTIAVLNDMGYTNAGGTYKQLIQAVDEGTVFAWHGGDLSYADDWYSGILPCEDDWPVCYNGTSTELPGPAPVPDYYKVPLPAGEVANQGGPEGGDMSVLYESNWDLWQQWIVNITAKVPYMTLPGNHEATCSEFDGPGNVLTAYLNNNTINGTAAKSDLTYYSCPPSQRNFTAYQHRFRMPGGETGGVGNMWYSFDYGMAHFISFDGETDFANSPEYPFARDVKGNETLPTEQQTYVTDSGPFGAVGNYSDSKTYAQYQWLQKDLASIDRCKTPWVIAMTHRPMYSSQVSSYQKYIRTAFEALLLEYSVDAYLSGHIHWYERMWPMGFNGTIDSSSIVNDNTYLTNPGKSMTHIVNGMAGNIESHSTLDAGESTLPLTAVLDFEHYGFSKIRFINESAITFTFIMGDDGSAGDELMLLKRSPGNGTCSSSSNSTSSSVPTSTVGGYNATSTATGSVSYTTEVVTAYTTYCPGAMTFTQGSSTYTVSSVRLPILPSSQIQTNETQATTLTITNCPCTITHAVTPTYVPLCSPSPTPN
ncbi:acid phosphatase AphA [Mollisia scopiformis]|uniref:Purple acid phosphatase n=1 Tax=Mollisia scopiformis TaxID=149040 RepID=A0A132B3B4_MOLSC|nr:acid phosphatase AphA [Mollisia scopiformis]KUJ06529.1 acid phosphatase AphA [Mollisia scopiformis]